ncbi:MAG TPA: endo-1,3-alpha-glucanase family glycosylhydrolase [Candidatus Angelobacter sp.]|nr:endo-1,3-alpha-glucanase family glycosylhydrolase [Candidatus Angelobacter sp.]
MAVLCLIAGCAQRRDIAQTLRVNLSPRGTPQILAAYQPWFGKPNHLNVGYSSQDPRVLAEQIEKAKNLGITGFVVNWYGRRDPFEDESYRRLQEVASQHDFSAALMYDESEDQQHSTDDAIRDLQYAYQNYIGPMAPTHGAYLSYDGRPLIFVFPKGGRTDWRKVRAVVNDWAAPPLLIYEDINQRELNNVDGFFAWVHPGRQGWSSDGRNWGRQYLDNFYSKMSSQYPDKLAVGAAWPGFNDRHASWSRNRYMNPRCGRTFEDSLRLFRRYYNDEHPLPFLLIVTWNDYEEGTAIERGMVGC